MVKILNGFWNPEAQPFEIWRYLYINIDVEEEVNFMNFYFKVLLHAWDFLLDYF